MKAKRLEKDTGTLPSGHGTVSPQWPFPDQLIKYSRANPPPSEGRSPRSKRATPTFADMMTEVGESAL